MFSLAKSEGLMQPIKVLLSPKREVFSECWTTFPKCTSNFEHFEQKHDPHN